MGISPYRVNSMAQRKKQTLKKKKAKVKKKKIATKKKLARKKPAVKKKTVRAKVKKKKKVTRKPKKKATPARAKKSIIKKKTASKKKSTSAKETTKTKRKSVKPFGKIKHKTLKFGVRVRIGKGYHIGQIGKIIGHDPYLGTFFVSFDLYKKDPVYKDLEWGPYFDTDIKLIS
jgi:hypothetical protein